MLMSQFAALGMKEFVKHVKTNEIKAIAIVKQFSIAKEICDIEYKTEVKNSMKSFINTAQQCILNEEVNKKILQDNVSKRYLYLQHYLNEYNREYAIKKRFNDLYKSTIEVLHEKSD